MTDNTNIKYVLRYKNNKGLDDTKVRDTKYGIKHSIRCIVTKAYGLHNMDIRTKEETKDYIIYNIKNINEDYKVYKINKAYL